MQQGVASVNNARFAYSTKLLYNTPSSTFTEHSLWTAGKRLDYEKGTLKGEVLSGTRITSLESGSESILEYGRNFLGYQPKNREPMGTCSAFQQKKYRKINRDYKYHKVFVVPVHFNILMKKYSIKLIY